MIKRCLLWLIWVYQKAISPLMPARCRYYPTCSEYAKQAIVWHGVAKGLPFVIKRVASCHPCGGSGVDFVPVPLYRYDYQRVVGRRCGFGVWADGDSYVSRLNWLMATRHRLS